MYVCVYVCMYVRMYVCMLVITYYITDFILLTLDKNQIRVVGGSNKCKQLGQQNNTRDLKNCTLRIP